jgi:spore coat assembly protein
LNRSEYFYLPGKILHIDGDKEYLDRCMNFYENMNVKANGLCLNEEDIADRIGDLIIEFKPDIVVITGHDSYNSRKDNNYQNTDNFINAVISARRYEKSQDKLLIVAGACQSNYEELIRAGANFASSPKRVNIDAYDPAIVAVKAAITPFNEIINLDEIKDLLESKKNGISGVESYGKMRLFL